MTDLRRLELVESILKLRIELHKLQHGASEGYVDITPQKEEATNWVKAHPPKCTHSMCTGETQNHESVSSYYMRYMVDAEHALKPDDFKEVVVDVLKINPVVRLGDASADQYWAKR